MKLQMNTGVYTLHLLAPVSVLFFTKCLFRELGEKTFMYERITNSGQQVYGQAWLRLNGRKRILEIIAIAKTIGENRFSTVT